MSDAIMSSLLSAQYDYVLSEATPRAQVMIASIPRSGSTAFCNDLWNTGVLGAPMEYLNLKWIEQHGRWAKELSNIVEYWRALQSVRTSPNGVFSYKLFVPNYFKLLERGPALLPLLAPTHVIYLTRNDLIDQAISYAKAMKSQHWFNTNGHNFDIDIEYDKAIVDNARTMIVVQQQQWESIFSMTGAEILRVSYEDYLCDKWSVVCTVMRYVCGSVENKNLEIPNITIQRDISTYEWKERYIRDCADQESDISVA